MNFLLYPAIRFFLVLLTIFISFNICTPASATRLPNEIYREKSLYRDVIVTEKDDKRCMSFGRYARLYQTCITPSQPNKLLLDYSKLLLGSLYFNPHPKRVLVIGLGGGIVPSVLQKIYPKVHLDLVEIDPAVIKVAAKYFNFKQTETTFMHTSDGRYYVKKALKQNLKYDLIFVDVFDENYIPEHLLTVEFLQETKKLLTPDGVIAINTFSSDKLYNAESNTFSTGLGDILSIRKTNRIILYKKSGLPSKEEIDTNANSMQATLGQFGIEKKWMFSGMSVIKDWDPNARVFTDQFSPVNLMNK